MKADYYIAPNGHDRNPGTLQKPFATIKQAQEAVRVRTKAGLKKDILVHARGGTYRLNKPIRFESEDSGTSKYSVTYAAFPGEAPAFSGGRTITGWKKLTKSVPGLNAKAKGKLWVADVADVKAEKWFFRELFVNGDRRTRARSPNQGTYRAVKVGPDRRTSFTFRKGDLRRTVNTGEAEMAFFHDWCTSRVPIKSVNTTNRVVTLTYPVGPGVERPKSWGSMDFFERHPRYVVENALEFLDQPGEWYLDRRKGKLYYYPRAGEDMTQAEVVAPVLTRLVLVEGPVKNLHFKGLAFAHAAFLRPKLGLPLVQAAYYEVRTDAKGKAKGRAPMPAAVEVTNATACSFDSCRFEHLGGSGLLLRRGCHMNRVIGNEFADISANGVMIGDGNESRARRNGKATWVADPDVIPKRNVVSNNHVHRCGRQSRGSVGIYVGLTDGTVISHNEIHDLPYTGISVGWMWDVSETPCANNIVEHNHIHHIMQELSDGGGIYTLGRQVGTVLRANHIHDIPPQHGRAESNGLFLDQGSSEYVVEGNAIYAVANSSIRFHQARNITVRKNTLQVATKQEPFRYNACRADTMRIADNTIVRSHAGKRTSRNGKVGNALLCDGVGSFLEVPHNPSLEPEQLTLEAWVSLAPYLGGKDTRRWIVNKNKNEHQNGHYGLIIRDDNVGAYLNIGGGKNNSFLALSDSQPLSLGRWLHLAMTYNGKALKVFADGVLVAEKEMNRKRKPGKLPLAIGRRQDGFTYFNGLIDEVRLYNKALPLETLRKRVKDPGNTQPKSSLVRRWTFEGEPEMAKSFKTIADNAGLQPAYEKKLGDRKTEQE